VDETLRALLTDLVIANRILAHEDVVDGFGHVSVRHPQDPQRYLMARSRSPELIGLEDLLEYHLDGTPVLPTTLPLFVERAIHGGIYEQRPDVHAICHNHADAVIPFSVTDEPLRPLVHVAASIGERVPVWDIADASGDGTDLLVRTIEQGRSLAAALDGGRVALLRGHGSVVAGANLRDVTMTSIYLKRNAALQLAARQLGAIRFLSPAETARAAEVHTVPAVVGRAWEYWRARAGFGGI
jgi:ribulose-5-phosphate 4-epimerase/fuculose-1-phosphate aldolase